MTGQAVADAALVGGDAVGPEALHHGGDDGQAGNDDVGAVRAEAVHAGAVAERPPVDYPHGSRAGWLRDPFGHRWGLSQRVRDVPEDEVSRAAAEFFGGAGP